MLTLKLRRTGKKHQPSYRLIVTEKRSKLGGDYLEGLGWYNPLNKKCQLDRERILYWLQHGAQKTDTVHNLLIKANVISGSRIAVHSKKNSKVDQIKEKETKMEETKQQMGEETTPVTEPQPEQPAAPAPEMPSPDTPAAPGEPQAPEAPVAPEAPAAPEEKQTQ